MQQASFLRSLLEIGTGAQLKHVSDTDLNTLRDAMGKSCADDPMMA
jgi:hypothetical protein